ncbi:MAG: hypothetical protein KA151_08560 [Piscinibacter sp.]|nr:hypothetical protein [Piscinibacter sp.]
MSHDLYSTRLYWAGTRGGIAKLHGLRVELRAAPRFGGAAVVAVDYIPEVGLRQIQPLASPWRDMTDDEVREADAALRAAVSVPL